MAELEPTRTRDWARILSVTQAVAIALALIMDAVIVTLHWHVMRHPPRHNWRPPVYSALVAIGALCALLPPGKGRLGRLPLAISLLALPLVGFVKPTLGIAGVMLAAIVVLRCTLVLGVRGGAVALAFALGECAIGVGEQFWFLHLEKRFPQGLRFTYLLAGLIGSLLLFGVGGGLMIAIVSLLRSERNARGELQEAHQQLQAYAVQAAHTAALEERARIALDVHDALGHGLTTLSVQLQSAARLRAQDAQKADAYVERAMATASLLLEDVRETVSVLRRDPDGAECFSDRARKLFTDFSQMDLLECTWHVALEQEPNGPIGIAL
ncbi:MAG TPA: histidine kinase, partial [Candidatus Baltobacteraceae bacterium]